MDDNTALIHMEIAHMIPYFKNFYFYFSEKFGFRVD